ncbi:MAG: serine/threonine-protein kinase [Terrimicrobiaceae bacterium]|nr:serine/threonine-protein kinase [Terrimicrobiaceae bacterium]
MNPPKSDPELHGLDPGELLARGINTAHPSGPVHEWTPPTPEELARLLPQYRIESILGRGGMGAVYKGSQEKLGRTVAIKVLPVELTADTQFVTRFEREARTLAKLHHPGIVSIYDFGQTGDGHLYFVMEYVEGTDLRRVLHGPGFDPAQALEITTQICEALHAAHLQGVVHRDIKPANILITTDGRVKLADFGLARPDREDHEPLTLTNAVLGTPDYMAPEQHAGQADLRTDIYALGLMLYEMLTGQLPRGAWTPPSRKVQVDVRIDEVVLKALQEEPDLRYQQASEMKTDVDSIRSGVAGEAPAQLAPKRPLRPWLIGAAALGVIALAVWGFAKFQESSRAGSAKVDPLSAAGPTVPAGLPLGAVEKPIPGVPNLRRFVWTDQETGLFTRLFLPAQADSGLLVRMRFSPELLTEEERAEGYTYDTLWEWVQVPPLAGEGENTIILKEGIPVWHRDKEDHNYVIRLLSGIFIPYENDDLAFADRISEPSIRVMHTPEGIRFIFSRRVGETDEPLLDIEIRALPHANLKAMFPELRGPGETLGEVAMWDWANEPETPNPTFLSEPESPDISPPSPNSQPHKP